MKYTIENRTDGPYVTETVIHWNGLTTESEVPDLEAAIEQWDLGDENLANAEAGVRRLERRVAELEGVVADVAPHRRLCSQCRPGHPMLYEDGAVMLCERHGLRVARGLDAIGRTFARMSRRMSPRKRKAA